MKISKLLLLTFFQLLIFSFQQKLQAQDLLRINDLSTIKVDQLTDQDIIKFRQQLNQSGLSQQQAEQLALSKGMPVAEVQKLRTRLQQVSTMSPSTQNQNNRGLYNGNNSNLNQLTDTTGYTENIDTTTPKPLIDPKIFGSEMFNNNTLNFAPNIPIATPMNYDIGPGDNLNISVYGVQEMSFSLQVSPEGSITIPNVGEIQVSGLNIESATQKIKNQMGRTAYTTVRNGSSKVAITLGSIKSIAVTIIGANKPGNYTLPSLATAFNALFVAGGPSPYGSFRDIELIRDNKLYKKIDLYRFLVNGDQSDNVTLRNNDVIRIPAYTTRVILDGYVKRPGIFEMLPNETFRNLLTFASGFSDSAYKAAVKVSQFTDREMSVKDVDASQYDSYQPGDGDSIYIGKLLNRYTNRIVISGAVFREGSYELVPDMTVYDLIKKADGLREDAFIQRGQIYRLKQDLTSEALSFVPSDSVINKSILLKREDSVVIKSIFDLRDSTYITMQGEIRSPGYYYYNDSLTLKDAILQAGGLTEAAYQQRIEVARLIRRDSLTARDIRSSEIIDINGMQDFASAEKNITLRASDVITIRRKPGFLALQTVNVSGQLQYPGPYVIAKREERVSDLIKRAGGFTPEAYLQGAFLRRYNISDQNSEARKSTIIKIQQQLSDSTNLVQQDIEKTYDQIPLNIDQLLAKPGSPEDVVLMPGDELVIPKFNAQVRISGSVLFPTQIPYDEGRNLRYYLYSAGGVSEDGKKSKIYVLYANGKAATTRHFLFFKNYPDIKPGMEIIVPSKPPKLNKLTTPELVAISSALASLAGVVIAILNL